MWCFVGLSHTKRREESSRAAQGVWQDAVMTLYEIPVKCWIYLQTHTHRHVRMGKHCLFLGNGCQFPLFYQILQAMSSRNKENFVFSLASTCDEKRDLWKTDLSTSLPFGRLQGFPLFPAGQTAQLTAPAPVLLPRAPWTSLKSLCAQSSECSRPPHTPLLDMRFPQPRKVFLAESYLVSKSSSHCPQGHSYAFLWGFRALPAYLTVVFVFISVSSSKPYDLSKVKNSLLLISAFSTSGPAPATE